MEKLVIGLGIALIAAFLVFVAVLFGTLIGALAGWVVGWFFETTILGMFAAFGITGFKMWQIGAFLGFVGGFFKASLSTGK